MNKKIFFYSLCLFFSFLNACSYSTFYVPKGQGVLAPSEASSIAISTQKNLKTNYLTLARVAAITWGGGETARVALQKEAAKLGANLIIDFRIERSTAGQTSASGLAVFMYQK